jgi:pantoate--beta-alanine ligase
MTGVSMHVFHDPVQLKEYLSTFRSAGKSVGFVPTMGALHDGHLSLVNQAGVHNDVCVVSIFVNPTQFNNPEDLRTYPRETDKDIEKLDQHSDCRVVFLPEVHHIYPEEISSEEFDLGGLEKGMEGTHRPGHFQGVATVVRRLFEMVSPDRAYFGEKDFQQLAIIRYMVKKLQLPVEVIGIATERNNKGLALSSRNQLLSEADREKALIIFESLKWLQENYSDFTPRELKARVNKKFASSALDLEYIEIADPASLKPIENWGVNEHARAFIAAQISGVRLIDNLPLF